MRGTTHHRSSRRGPQRLQVITLIATIAAIPVLAEAVGHSNISQLQPTDTRSLPTRLDRVPHAATARPAPAADDRQYQPLMVDPPPTTQPPDDRGLHLVNSPVTLRARTRWNTSS
jgi:hypothetical protein